MNIKDRIHTWAADNFKSVQYPNIRVQPRNIPPAVKLDFGARVLFGVLGFCGILIGVIGAAIGLFVMVGVIAAFF